MNVSLTDELKDFVRKKIQNGQYPSEEAVVEAALKRLRDQEDESSKKAPTLRRKDMHRSRCPSHASACGGSLFV